MYPYMYKNTYTNTYIYVPTDRDLQNQLLATENKILESLSLLS